MKNILTLKIKLQSYQMKNTYFKDIEFPFKYKDIPKFKNLNKFLTVNVFGIK